MIITEELLYSELIGHMVEEEARKRSHNLELLLSKNVYVQWLKNYLVWRFFINDEEKFTDEIRYINLYYWFSGFYKLYKEIHGLDAGIEQQQANLLEEISLKLPNFDWEQLISLDKKIEDEIKRENS